MRIDSTYCLSHSAFEMRREQERKGDEAADSPRTTATDRKEKTSRAVDDGKEERGQ